MAGKQKKPHDDDVKDEDDIDGGAAVKEPVDAEDALEEHDDWMDPGDEEDEY